MAGWPEKNLAAIWLVAKPPQKCGSEQPENGWLAAKQPEKSWLAAKQPENTWLRFLPIFLEPNQPENSWLKSG